MSCPKAVQVPTFVKGTLDANLARSMRAHIEECDACFLEVAAAAAAISQEVPAGSAAESSGSLRRASGTSFVGAARALGPEFPLEHAPAVPDWIGPYRIESVIGEGGMGIVYRGVDENGHRVAVKTVRVPTRSLFESLRQEIQLLNRTRHPGIVRVLDYDLSGGDPWYAMEFIPGDTLGKYIRQLWPTARQTSDSDSGTVALQRRSVANGKLVEVLSLFRKLCEPLAFLHREGIVHSDLKPSNIQLRPEGEPVLMDFGLVTYARGAVDREALSFVTGPRGTPAYVAPEVIQGHVPDPRADLYAIGCILYETLTGRPPFVGTREEVVHAQLNTAPARASELVDEMPPALDALLSKLMAKDFKNRFGHVADLERELGVLSGAPSITRIERHVFFRPQMVGRAEDLASFELCLQRLNEGRGAIVLVAGESGIGKTFFASEAARKAAARKVKVVVGECDPPTALAAGSLDLSSSALSPLRRYFEFLRDSCREGGGETISRLLGGALPTLAPYSPALAALKEQTDIPELSKLPPEAGRERLLAALTQTLAAATAQAPLLLVLDDLQWADELTLALFETLRAMYLERLPLLILATYRSEEQTRAIRELASQPDVTTLRLERLDRSAVASMVSDMVGVGEPESDLVDFVFSHAEGVPFFTAEYLRSIVSEGLLTRKDESFRLSSEISSASPAGLRSLPFPVRLAELIRRRIGGLSPTAIRALEAAATLGREFDLQVLADMLGMTPEETYRHVEASQARQIVFETPGRSSLRFAHDKFRETIYGGLGPAERSALHGRAARALEHHHRGKIDFEYFYGDIAWHFRLAGNTGAAIDYLERAGERALRISADAEALQFLSETLDLERTLDVRVHPLRRARWERGVSEALHGLGRLAQSTEPLARAAELLGHPFPRSPAATGFAIASHLLRRLVPRTPASDDREKEVSLEMGRVLERVLRISYYTGENLQMLYACVASLNFCERAGASADLALAYLNAAATASVVPLHRLADSYFDRAAALLRENVNPVVESQLRMLESAYNTGLGAQTKAISSSTMGIAVAKQIGFHRRIDECMALRSAVDIHAGRHGEIEERSLEIEASARRRGDAQMLSWALLQRLECLVMRGAFQQASRELEGISPLLALSERPEKIWILSFAAYVRYRRGEIATALEHADEAAALVRKGALVQSYVVNSLDRLAELRILHWRRHSSSRATDRKLGREAEAACSALRGIARIFPFAVPGASLQTGLLLFNRGKRKGALSAFRKGAAEAKRMDLAYHEARLRLALGKASPNAAERRSSLERAAELLKEIDVDESTLQVDTWFAR